MKVAVKDVIGATRDERRHWPKTRERVWWAGHFDFVVTSRSDDEPEFVVEFDGPDHELPDVQNRDRAMNTLCRDAEIPMLRISGDGNMLTEYERTCVVEHMVQRFVGWDQERPANFDASYMGRRFPPLEDIIIRLVNTFEELRKLEAFNDETAQVKLASHNGEADYSRELPRLSAYAVVYQKPHTSTSLSFCGANVQGEGVRTLFSTQKWISFSWRLPVDDEQWMDIGGLRIPQHRMLLSDLPGNCLPSVPGDVAEYLALKDVEQWVQAKLTR